MSDGNPLSWSNFSWVTEVADMPGNEEDQFALSFVAKEIMEQVGQANNGSFVIPVDVAFACLHEGDVPRCETHSLTCADPEVEDWLILQDQQRPQLEWTVCGILKDSWQPVHFLAVAGSPLVAYFKAWQWAGAQSHEHMLLAAVHPEHVPNIGTFRFADPWAHDAMEMRLKAQSWSV